MKSLGWVRLASLCLFIAGIGAPVVAQDFPGRLLEALPNAAEKLTSEDVAVRASILNGLLVPVPMSCTGELNLPFDLNKEDYRFVVGQILEKDMRQLDDKTAGTAWHFLTHLIRKFEMKEFAGPIAEYLNEEYRGASGTSIQYGIISTLQALQAKEFDSKIAPYTTASPALSYIALETLISFKSKKAIPALLAKFSDKNKTWWALDKLVEIGAIETAPQIAELLKDEEENISYGAIDALVRLNAKPQAKDLWQFLKYSDNDRFKGYAVAALIQFGEKEAITIAIDHLKRNAEGSQDYYVWEFIDKLKPTPLIPALVSLYNTKTAFFANAEHEKKFRWDVFQTLVRFKTPLAIPIYRQHLVDRFDAYNPHRPDPYMAGILLDLNATEAFDDMIQLFNDSIKPGAGSDANYRAGELAIILAKTGDRRTWKMLVDYAEKSDYYARENIFIELNKFLDKKLWDEMHARIPKQSGAASIKTIANQLSSETGLPISLEYAGKKDVCGAEDTREFGDVGCGYITGSDSVFNVVRLITSRLNEKPRGEYTFVFDHGTVRVLTTQRAVEWWRKNILTKTD